MITPLLVALVLADPYGGFRCRLHPFGRESLYPWSVDILEERGYDVSSLLYRQRARFIELLGFAHEPAKFDPGNVNLWIHYQKRTWIVDSSGTVQCGKSSLRLDKDEFRQLQEEIELAIPRLDRDDNPPPRRGGTAP